MTSIPTSTSAEFVIDTNVAIDFLNAPDAATAKIGAAAVLLVPAIVLGELYLGARKSGRPDANVRRVELLASSVVVTAADLETARQYGILQHALRLAGRPIPQNDAWIAATALQLGRPLVTRDHHFDHVPGLSVVPW